MLLQADIWRENYAVVQALASSARHGGSYVEVIPVPPWREESTPQAFGNVLSADWIPALRQAQGKLFAGMTCGSSGSPFQMTPAPCCEFGCARREFVLVMVRLSVVDLIPDFDLDAVRSV